MSELLATGHCDYCGRLWSPGHRCPPWAWRIRASEHWHAYRAMMPELPVYVDAFGPHVVDPMTGEVVYCRPDFQLYEDIDFHPQSKWAYDKNYGHLPGPPPVGFWLFGFLFGLTNAEIAELWHLII